MFPNLNQFKRLFIKFIIFISLNTLNFVKSQEFSECILPSTWSGLWSNQQQNKEQFQQDSSNNYVFNSATVTSAHNSQAGSNSLFKIIDDNNFLNKGRCINNKDERYFFYDKNEKCFRCLFIIQRHYNVLQYRETHCDEEMTKFEELCELLSPDLPLLTMIREDAIAEKCPLTDSYQVFTNKHNNQNNQRSISLNHKDQIIHEKYNFYDTFDYRTNKLGNLNPNKCFKKPESNIISKCVDQTMLRIDFQDCFNFQSSTSSAGSTSLYSNENKNKKLETIKSKEPSWIAQRLLSSNSSRKISKESNDHNSNDNQEDGLVAQCIAHWTEGNLNYLIVKQRNTFHHSHSHHHSHKNNHLLNYKCLIYKDLDRPFKNTNNNNILNPTNNLIQISLSEDEFCRDFYVTPDGMNTFTLEKNKPITNLKQQNRYLVNKKNSFTHYNQNSKCKFPKILNKKWKNLQQTKYAFNINSNLLHIVFESININKQRATINQTSFHYQSKNKKHSINNHKSQNQYDSIFLRLSCIESLNKHNNVNDQEENTSFDHDLNKHDHVYLVNNLLECSSKQRCLSIKFKSDFIIHINYANYDIKNKKCLFDKKNIIYQDLLFIETDFGIDCPFSNRIYQLSADNNEDKNRNKRNLFNKESQFSSIFGNSFPIFINNHNYEDTDCEHYLKIGCNSNDYTIYKKCEYSFTNKQNNKNSRKIKKDSIYSAFSMPTLKYSSNTNTNQLLPVIESETNRICLAYWKLDKNSYKSEDNSEYDDDDNDDEYDNDDSKSNEDQEVYVVLSKLANAENYTVTCSMWESGKNKLKITDDESLNLCLNNKNTKRISKKDYHKNTNKNQMDSSVEYVNNNENSINEYAVSTASASAMLSNNWRFNDENSFLFDYTGSCSSTNNAQKQIKINFLNKIIIFYFIMVLFILK